MKSGVYKILNKANGKFYIGSSVLLKRRNIYHFSALRCSRHVNRYLQSAWNKYGEDAFEFTVIENCEEENLLKREQFWLDYTKCYNREIGYNLSRTAGSLLGSVTSQETKIKLSKALKGIKRSAETRAKMSAWQIGRKMSDEAKRNMTLAKTGTKYRRNSSKWPCVDGCYCRCEKCSIQRKSIKKNWDRKNSGIKSFIMIECANG